MQKKLVQYNYCKTIQENKVMIKIKVLDYTMGIIDVIMVSDTRP